MVRFSKVEGLTFGKNIKLGKSGAESLNKALPALKHIDFGLTSDRLHPKARLLYYIFVYAYISSTLG